MKLFLGQLTENSLKLNEPSEFLTVTKTATVESHWFGEFFPAHLRSTCHIAPKI